VSYAAASAFALVFVAATTVAAVADDAAKSDQTAPPVSPAIQVSPGDSWTYDIRDDITGEVRGTVTFEVAKVTEAEIETRVAKKKQLLHTETTSKEIFDSHWRMKDNGKVVFRPALETTGVPDDLAVGKSWSFKHQASPKGSAVTREFAGVGKVEAWEHVTLPNGSGYDAFKIDVTAAAAIGNRKQEQHSIMWFAPAVNRLVKRKDESRANGILRDATEQTLREYKRAAKI